MGGEYSRHLLIFQRRLCVVGCSPHLCAWILFLQCTYLLYYSRKHTLTFEIGSRSVSAVEGGDLVRGGESGMEEFRLVFQVFLSLFEPWWAHVAHSGPKLSLLLPRSPSSGVSSMHKLYFICTALVGVWFLRKECPLPTATFISAWGSLYLF